MLIQESDLSNSFLKTSFIIFLALLVVCPFLPRVNASETSVMIWKSPTFSFLFSVYMVSANDGWAVGGPGTIIRWDGNSWNNVTSANGLFPGPNAWCLESVFMLTSDNGWAVGYRNEQDPIGAVAHWNGTIWRDVTDPASNVSGSLNSVFMVNSSDGWAVSTFGVIVHWDGENWSRAPSPTNETLLGVSMISSSDGWAVGDIGTIIRWNGTEWIPELPIPIFALFVVAFLSVSFILESARYRRIVWNVRVSRRLTS